MENTGTHFKYGILPINIVKECDGKLKVVFSDNSIDTFDTVLYATGRSPDLADMSGHSYLYRFTKCWHSVIPKWENYS